MQRGMLIALSAIMLALAAAGASAVRDAYSAMDDNGDGKVSADEFKDRFIQANMYGVRARRGARIPADPG